MLEDDIGAYDADGLRALLSTSFDKVAKVLDEHAAAKLAFVSQLSRHVQLGTVDWSDCRAPGEWHLVPFNVGMDSFLLIREL